MVDTLGRSCTFFPWRKAFNGSSSNSPSYVSGWSFDPALNITTVGNLLTETWTRETFGRDGTEWDETGWHGTDRIRIGRDGMGWNERIKSVAVRTSRLDKRMLRC